ncbi:hypothetical protein GF340_01325 [Candidatus Peregrinibacteria bacterium]|nr:hypothetical protein [Candidatus Peregrinibacteria bacterium]
MSGEYINASTIEDYWNELKLIYERRSTEWKNLTQEQYEAIEKSEREDSDNHLNEERIGDETDVIDICFYKFLPERKVAYHIEIKHKDGNNIHKFFQITLKENIDQ